MDRVKGAAEDPHAHAEPSSRLFLFASQVDCHLAQEFGRLLRRDRVNVEAGAPLETGHARQPRNHLDMPVIMRQRLRVERRGMNDVVIGRPVEGGFQL